MSLNVTFVENEIPRVFTQDRRKESAFWAWLTGEYLVPDIHSDTKAIVQSRVEQKELKKRIANANLQNTGELQRLLEIAEDEPMIDGTTVRRSARLQKGTYLKMFYAKLLLQSSFSDVAVKMLSPALLEAIEVIRKRPYSTNRIVQARLNHLAEEIHIWKAKNPESRDGSIGLERTAGRYLIPEYSERAMEYRDVLVNFGLAQVEGRLERMSDSASRSQISPHVVRSRSQILAHFVREWKEELRKDALDCLGFEVAADRNAQWVVKVNPELSYSRELEHDKLRETIDEFGSEELQEFAGWLKGDTPIKESDLFSDKHILLCWTVRLPAIIATPVGEEEINVEFADKKEEDNSLDEAVTSFMGAVRNLADWMRIVPEDYFARERNAALEYAKSPAIGSRGHSFGRLVLESSKLSGLVDLAASKASTKEEFAMIRKVISRKNLILDYRKVTTLLEDTVERSLSTRSVISFYINPDVWRLADLVLKENGWGKLAEMYVSTGVASEGSKR